MSTQDLTTFEDGVRENGSSWWSARWLMELLDYASWSSFKGVVTRALTACMNLGLDVSANFTPYRRDNNGRPEEDFKLTRFACFLIANNADGKKPAVEQVKAYLASIAAAAVAVSPDVLERLEERETLKVGEKAMTSAAAKAGVQGREMAMFKDAGYRGMYNMSLKRLKTYKGIDTKDANKTLYDFMGIAELAANSFRVTQTAERLRRREATGFTQAEAIAKGVGSEVRSMMMSDGGDAPENLELEEHINRGKSVLKKASRHMAKIDKPSS